jgi:hypothetical protein
MKRPVFVVGCPRSGTTLLYSFLIAAGGFAAYRKETHFYDLLPRFPNLSGDRPRRRFLDEYLRGHLGRVPGLEVEPLAREALSQCAVPGDFLPRLMNGIARAQGVERWVEGTPTHVLYMHEIKQSVPDALFIHMIRDGRDCALSTDRQHWIRTLPWDRERGVGVAALFWEWNVRVGRTHGRQYAHDYLEVRFENLIASPRATLDRVGRFIDHDLDYDRIEQHPVHAMRKPNTSFGSEREQPGSTPVGRWKKKCSPEELELCELLIGPSLEELGYPLACADRTGGQRMRARLMRALYLPQFSIKHTLKAHTPFGRWTTNTGFWALPPGPRDRQVFSMIAAAVEAARRAGSGPTPRETIPRGALSDPPAAATDARSGTPTVDS